MGVGINDGNGAHAHAPTGPVRQQDSTQQSRWLTYAQEMESCLIFLLKVL